MKTRVLVQGYYGAGNLGDDALMVACFELLRQLYPPKAITFRARPAPYLHRLAPGARVTEPESLLDSVDLLVYGGGTQHFTFPLTVQRSSPPAEPPAATPPLPAWRRLFHRERERSDPLIARRAALGVGFGPFEREQDQEEPKQLFQQVGYIAVRDLASLETCHRWGLDHAVLRSDLCFLPGLWGEIIRVGRPHPQRPFRIGVIVRDWPHSIEGAAYQEPLWPAVACLRNEGIQVSYALFQKGEAWESELTRRGERFDVWDPDGATIPQFLNRLAHFDCLLTARYHGAVFGALLGVPTICIEIEPKLRQAADLLTSGKYLWKFPFDVETCLALVHALFCEYESAQMQLAQIVPAQQQLAAQMAAELKVFAASVARSKAVKRSPVVKKLEKHSN